jgi:hypothetical protein
MVDILGSSVIAAYDATMSQDARRAAIGVVVDSRKLLLDRVGEMTSQRATLVKALRSAVAWLELLLPLSDVPEMAALRQTLAEAEAGMQPAQGFAMVSHGICTPCVERLYPQQAAKVRASKDSVKDPVSVTGVLGILRICCGCGVQLA